MDSLGKRRTDRGMAVAFFLNLIFALIELVGGFLTNSVAILSDAIHDLGDTVVLGVAWYAERFSRKGRDARHSYGYRRYSILGAIISALVLVAGTILVIREAVQRLANPEDVHAPGMFALAALGIAVNAIAYRRLHGGHSHNVRVVQLHLLEDVLGWIAVLIGSVCIYFWDLTVLDPLLSIGIAVFILWQVVKRLRQSMGIVAQAVPASIDLAEITRKLTSLPDITDLHDVHVWTMDGKYHVLTIHVVLTEQKTMSEITVIKRQIRNALRDIGVDHTTVEFEYPDEDCDYLDYNS